MTLKVIQSPSAKASQTKESVAENQATKQIQTNQESSGTVKKRIIRPKLPRKIPQNRGTIFSSWELPRPELLSLAIATYCFKVKR